LQAAGRADLWDGLFGQELVFIAAQPAVAAVGEEAGQAGLRQGCWKAGAPPPVAVEAGSILPNDPMAEAGRRCSICTSRGCCQRGGHPDGEDPEALHDMRVATRRMRAAFALFAPYYERKNTGAVRQGLAAHRPGTSAPWRDLGRPAGQGRSYQAALPPEGAGALEPLLVHWQTRREVARRQMLNTWTAHPTAGSRTDFECSAVPWRGSAPAAGG